jgi:hypothetical protein
LIALEDAIACRNVAETIFMKKSKNAPILTIAEAQALVNIDKVTVRPMEWLAKRTASNPQWLEFVSVCRIRNEIREDLFFRSQFRARKTVSVGKASMDYQEQFNAALCAGGERILAVDADSTPHKNKVGHGRPWYNRAVGTRCHIHTWSAEGYGYAEPVSPDLDDIESLIDFFLPRANLTLVGGFTHPLHGTQLALLQ